MEKTRIFIVCFLSFLLCSHLGYLPHLTQNPQNLTDRLLERFSKYVPFFKPQKTHWIQKLYQGLTSSWNEHFSRRAATRHWYNEMSNCRIFIRFVGCLILITKIINGFRSQHFKKCYKKKNSMKKSRSTGRRDDGIPEVDAPARIKELQQQNKLRSTAAMTPPESVNMKSSPNARKIPQGEMNLHKTMIFSQNSDVTEKKNLKFNDKTTVVTFDRAQKPKKIKYALREVEELNEEPLEKKRLESFKKKGARKKDRRKRRHDEQNVADHSSGARENVEACSSVPSGCELIVCQKTVRKQECIEYIINEGEERILITRDMIYQHTKYLVRRDDRRLNEE